MLPENVALFTAIVDSMSQAWNVLHSPFDFDPVPVHVLNAIHPKSRFVGVLSIVIVIASPEHQVLLIDVDEVCYLFGRLHVSDDLLDPNIGFGAHWAVQEPQLVKIVKQQICHAILLRDHPLSSEQV